MLFLINSYVAGIGSKLVAFAIERGKFKSLIKKGFKFLVVIGRNVYAQACPSTPSLKSIFNSRGLTTKQFGIILVFYFSFYSYIVVIK